MAMAARADGHFKDRQTKIPGAAPYLASTAVPKPRHQALPEERPAVRERKRTVVREKTKSGTSPFTVVGLLTAAFLIMLVIAGYVQLYEATSQVADLNDQLEAAQQNQVALQSQYESKVDLDYVEEVATTQLGMTQPAANQVVYLDISEPDHAEIVVAEEETTSANVFTALWDSVNAIIGYFRAYFA
jgi:cell division protein FtsL